MTDLPDDLARTDATFAVDHRPERNRFEVRVDEALAVLEYLRVGSTLIFIHTEVPAEVEGRGIGGALARAGLEYVKDNDLTAAVLCPFVKAYLSRHPEYQPLIRLRG